MLQSATCYTESIIQHDADNPATTNDISISGIKAEHPWADTQTEPSYLRHRPRFP